MKRLGTLGPIFLLAVACILLTPYAQAEELSFTEGQKLEHALSVCLDKADAIEIAKVDEAKGFEAASAVWNNKARCASVPVVGPSVGKVVLSVKAKRNGASVTASVVEILGPDGEVMAYFLTTSPVKPAVKGINGKALNLKPERNA